MEKPQATAVVAAMQDRARLDWVRARGEDEMPNLLLNWLWFRRYTLAYPECCTRQEAQCHILRAEGRSKWAVTEAEYPQPFSGGSLLITRGSRTHFVSPDSPGAHLLSPGSLGYCAMSPGFPGHCALSRDPCLISPGPWVPCSLSWAPWVLTPHRP